MSDPELEARWAEVVEKWDDPAVHDAFVEHCRQTTALAEAAARYRSVLEGKGDAYRDNARGAEAQKRLERIAVLAMYSLQQEKTDPAIAKPPRWVLVGVGFLVVLAIYSLLRAFG